MKLRAKRFGLGLLLSGAGLPVAATSAAAVQERVPELEAVARIGCEFCEGPRSFSGIRALALGPEGRVYVADRSEPLFRVFDAKGELRTAFGREGRGPGEARLTLGLLPYSGGLVTVDMKLARITRYDSAGAVVDARRLELFPLEARSDPRAGAMILPFADWSSGSAGVARYDADADTLSTVLEPPIEFLASDSSSGVPVFSTAAAPDGGFVLGDGGREEYRIRRYDANGHGLFDYTRPIARRAKTPEEMAEDRERIAGARGRLTSGADPESGGGPIEVTPYRRHFGAHSLEFDDAGRLWVQADRAPPSLTLFDVFGTNGAYLGTVELEALVGTFVIRAGRLAGVVKGDYDIERIGVWRLVELEGGR